MDYINDLINRCLNLKPDDIDLANALRDTILPSMEAHFGDNFYTCITDYLHCACKYDCEPSNLTEVANVLLDPALDEYHFTCMFLDTGYIKDSEAYEDIGYSLLKEAGIDLEQPNPSFTFDWGRLNLNTFFDYEHFAKEYFKRNNCKVGRFGYLAQEPIGYIIISKDEIIELANYLSGAKYDEELIQSISEKVNTFVLNDEVSPHIDQERTNTPHDLTAEIQAAITAANKQETVNPQASLKHTRKH